MFNAVRSVPYHLTPFRLTQRKTERRESARIQTVRTQVRAMCHASILVRFTEQKTTQRWSARNGKRHGSKIRRCPVSSCIPYCCAMSFHALLLGILSVPYWHAVLLWNGKRRRSARNVGNTVRFQHFAGLHCRATPFSPVYESGRKS